MKNDFPMQQAMAIACNVLGIAPPHFWCMTPVEFYVCLEDYLLRTGRSADAAPTRQDILGMMELFPDQGVACEKLRARSSV